MQLDFPTDRLAFCECGNKPTHYTQGYSRTPFYMQCLGCNKMVTSADNPEELTAAWNHTYHKYRARGQVIDLQKKFASIKALEDELPHKIHTWLSDAKANDEDVGDAGGELIIALRHRYNWKDEDACALVNKLLDAYGETQQYVPVAEMNRLRAKKQL